MIKYFYPLIFLFFTFLQLSSAQENKAVGFFFDHYGDPIDGYIGNDYSPQSKLILPSNLIDDYRKGNYYTKNDERIEGYIKFSPEDDYFLFSEDGIKRKERIKASICQSVSMGLDSFVVVEDFKIYGEILNQRVSAPKFAQVIEVFDDRIYYTYLHKTLDAYLTHYLYREQGVEKLQAIGQSDKKFKETATEAFINYPSIIQKINEEEYKESDFLEIIKVQKYLWAFNTGSNIYVNRNLQEISKKEDALYYLEVKDIQNSSYKLAYYTIDGLLSYEGNFRSINPFEREGISRWFHTNGQLRKEINYSKYSDNVIKVFDNKGRQLYAYHFDEERAYYHYSFFADNQGNNALKANGDAQVSIYDQVNNREIKAIFGGHKLVEAYYLNDAGEKIYLRTDKNVALRGETRLKTFLMNAFRYPGTSFDAGNDGIVHFKFIIDKKGYAESIEIIKGVDQAIDSTLLNIISFTKTYRHFKPAKKAKSKVKSEVVVAVQVILRNRDPFRYNNMYWMHQQMFFQPTPTIINLPPMPSNRF